MPIVDNIVFFKHVKYPLEIIQSPPYIIIIHNIKLNKTYTYGCFVLPVMDEITSQLVPARAYDNELYDIFEYNSEDYRVDIIET